MTQGGALIETAGGEARLYPLHDPVTETKTTRFADGVAVSVRVSTGVAVMLTSADAVTGVGVRTSLPVALFVTVVVPAGLPVRLTVHGMPSVATTPAGSVDIV